MNENLQALFLLNKAIKTFFETKQFLEVLTPPMVQNPGMETHIHPFSVASARNKKLNNLYLHTSPEFSMKKLLTEGFDKIFQISYCFRDEPTSKHHRQQFLMLEWYRTDEHYEKIMEDTQELILFCHNYLNDNISNILKPIHKLEHKTVQEIFFEFLNIDILELLTKDKLLDCIKKSFKEFQINQIQNLSWEDLFFLLFLNKIEPQFSRYPALLLKEYPAPLAALSTLKEDDERVCERFEIYLNGLELCNCFNELTSFAIQKDRFDTQKKEKENLYNYSLPEPNEFYDTLRKGLPTSSGIAMGVERLLMSLTEIEDPFFN